MRLPRPLHIAAAVALGAIALTACSPTTAATPRQDRASATASAAPGAGTVPAVWDSNEIHTFALEYDEGDFESLMSTYVSSGEKVWITATVTIDGTTYENVGLKLKGNSSLRGASMDDAAQDLPWIIRLDKYVDGQSHEGAREFAVRSNSSETSLNEALALELLDAAGLAAEEAIAAEFSANGSDPTLRLVIENPHDAWMERELGDGLLYKAESTGDWSYRGDDPDAYAEAFDQEGGEDDLEPLIAFLEFVNHSDDDTFAQALPAWLDVDAFATYLAFQEVVQNSDDIDGPGNNAYLYWDPETEQMTVVNWDLNLAFGATPGGAGGGFDGSAGAPPGDSADAGAGMAEGAPEGMRGTPPEDFDPSQLPEGADVPQGGAPGERGDGGFGGRGGMGGSNVLVERFLANADFAALYEAELERLEAELIDSGLAQEQLEAWTDLLLTNATTLVQEATVNEESEALEARLVE